MPPLNGTHQMCPFMSRMGDVFREQKSCHSCFIKYWFYWNLVSKQKENWKYHTSKIQCNKTKSEWHYINQLDKEYDQLWHNISFQLASRKPLCLCRQLFWQIIFDKSIASVFCWCFFSNDGTSAVIWYTKHSILRRREIPDDVFYLRQPNWDNFYYCILVIYYRVCY